LDTHLEQHREIKYRVTMYTKAYTMAACAKAIAHQKETCILVRGLCEH
jgi:hypothetical protein